MARMIPPYVASTAPKGERQLFAKLRDAPGTDDWVVFHSFDIRRHIKRSEGEADMLVVVPRQGVLCIEVKGCDVSRKDGLWTYMYNPPRTTSVGPFRQASEAAHSVRKYLGSKELSLGALMFHSAVVFTEIDFPWRSLEWEPWQAVGKTELLRNPIATLLTRVLEHAHAKCKSSKPVPFWYTEHSSRPNSKQVQAITNILRGDFEYTGAAMNGVVQAEAAIRRFTEEQFEAIDHINDNRRVLFRGPAGTGKTFLAIEAAKRAISQHKSTALLCFNVLLANWIKRETEQIAADARKLGITFYAGTVSRLMLDVAHAEVPASAGALFWEETLPILAADALLQNETPTPKFDTLLIDEAQDILTDPFLDVVDLLLEGGLAGGRWAMFGDFERQAIFAVGGVKAGEDRLRGRVGEAISTYRLRINCRNSLRIAEAVTITSGMSPGYSRVLNDGDWSDVEPLFYKNAAHQLQLLRDTISRLLKSFSPDQIVILSTRADSASCAARLTGGEGFRLAPFRQDSGSEALIRYASVHAFKGMESPAIVLTDIETIEDDQSKALLYIGMSRARIQLHVVMSERLRRAYGLMLDTGLKAALGKGA